MGGRRRGGEEGGREGGCLVDKTVDVLTQLSKGDHELALILGGQEPELGLEGWRGTEGWNMNESENEHATEGERRVPERKDESDCHHIRRFTS